VVKGWRDTRSHVVQTLQKSRSRVIASASRSGRQRVIALAVLLCMLAAGASPRTSDAQGLNPIQTENALPGTTSWELTSPAPEEQISGYASQESVRPGDSISFSVRTLEPRFSASVYRMGWYGGDGARLMRVLPSIPGHDWSVPKPDPRSGLLICHWPISFSIAIPIHGPAGSIW